MNRYLNNFVENERKRIFGYLRLSKEDFDTRTGKIIESCSISSQRMYIKQFLKEKLAGQTYVYEEILDDGYSGTNMDRPGMSKLLHLVKAGAVDTIIVRDLSRFARNYIEAGYYIEFIFPSYNIHFISIDDKFDSEIVGEKTGGFELALKNLMNSLYSKDLSRKIKSTMDYKKLNGQYVYGAVPFGYLKGGEKNTIVIDEEAAKIVRRIFKLASEGNTVTQIAKKFNEEKIITPSFYLAEKRKNYKKYPHWTYESVRNILQNRIYTGDTVPFKSHVIAVGSNKVKQVPLEEQEVILSTHDPIISREIFFEANRVVKRNKKSKPQQQQGVIANLLVCGCCDKKLQKGRATNQNYKCATARYVTDLKCSEIKINEKRIKEVVLRAIERQYEISNERISFSRGNIRMKNDFDIILSEQKKLEKELKEIEQLKMKFYEKFVDGLMTKEEFLKLKRKCAEEKEGYKAQLKLLEKQFKNFKEEQQHKNTEEQFISKYKEFNELYPEIVRELIQKIVVYPEGVQIVWNFADYFDNPLKLE